MMKYDPQTDMYSADNRPAESKRDRWLMLIIIIIVIMAFCAGRATASSAAADALCAYFDALADQPGVEVATWVGYPSGWRDYPAEWDYEVFLPLLEGGILQRVSGSQQWLWGYRSLETWTDSNGDHDGHHDFCETVLVLGP